MKRAKLVLLLFSLLLILGCENSASLGKADTPIQPSGGESEIEVVAPPKPAPPIAKASRPASNFGNDAFISTLEKAKMVFNPPQYMTVNTTESMRLIIDLEKTFDALEKSFGANEALSRRDLLVSEQLEVTLSGAAFAIKAITPEKQYLSKLESTVWKWDVTAKEAGEHNLNLIVTAIAPDGKNRVRTFDEVIEVKTLPLMDQAIAFFKSEYKWLFSAFIIPIFLWYMKTRKGKKEEKNKEA